MCTRTGMQMRATHAHRKKHACARTQSTHAYTHTHTLAHRTHMDTHGHTRAHLHTHTHTCTVTSTHVRTHMGTSTQHMPRTRSHTLTCAMYICTRTVNETRV